MATTDSPDDPNRQLEDCEPIDEVVVQERLGETRVTAIAIDLQTVI